MRRSLGFFLGLTFLAGCGGSSFSSGSGGNGGTSSAGTSSAGTSSAGTSPGTGGSVGSGGSVSTGGAGGSINCGAVDCAAPYCPDGQLVTPPGQCCPVCSCDTVSCPAIDCADGPPIMQPGSCCPVCPPPPPPSCENVECQPQVECSLGYTWKRTPGACCAACLPDSGPVGCLDIACPMPLCPPGYVQGDLVGDCCYNCLPDPLYCTSDSDCMIANRPRPCCECPEAISTRMYSDDVCWYDVNAPRTVPQECYPDFVCDAICAPCPGPGTAVCQQNRCSEVFPQH